MLFNICLKILKQLECYFKYNIFLEIWHGKTNEKVKKKPKN